MEREIKVGNIYKHFKGNLYEVIALAYDSETNNETEPRKLVVYKALYGDGKVWVRDYEMFISKVDKHKYPEVLQEYRFEEVKKKDLKIELSVFDSESETPSNDFALLNPPIKNIGMFGNDLQIIDQEWNTLPDAGLCDSTLNNQYSSNNLELKNTEKVKEKRK